MIAAMDFYLSLGIQELFGELRNDQTIPPDRQTQSKKVSVVVTVQHKRAFFHHFQKI